MGAGDGDHVGSDARRLQVERQLVVAAELGVELGQPGHTLAREPLCRHPVDPDLAEGPQADGPVVDQDDLAVAGQPGVGLEARHTRLQGPPEGRDGVLGELGPGPPVGEGDGRIHAPIVREK